MAEFLERLKACDRQSSPFHTFFFAAYPVLFFLAQNVEEIDPSKIGLSLIGGLTLALFVFIIFTRLLVKHDLHRAALMASLVIMVFFSYGHIRLFFKSTPYLVNIGRHRYLLPIMLCLLGVGLWWIAFRQNVTASLTRRANILAIVLLVLPTIRLSSYLYEILVSQSQANARQDISVGLSIENSWVRPDIYYIILDGYARSDILQELYDYDNGDFIQELEKRGFYIAHQSYSNYNKTILSFASSLNMDYVNSLANSGERSPTWGQLRILVKHSRIMKILTDIDYESVAFETSYSALQIDDVDHYITFSLDGVRQFAGIQLRMDEFEWAFLETTLLSAVKDALIKTRILGEPSMPYDIHRTRILGAFQTLQELPQWEGDYLVIAHIISPHPPFVFDGDGSPVDPSHPPTLRDGNKYLEFSNRDEYVQGYRKQVKFVSNKILQTIDTILETSSEPPIIILQSDHGPGAYTDFRSMDRTYLPERFAILNAYYLPERSTNQLYPSISPVNSFRMVLNAYFGEEYPILEDRSYFDEDGSPNLLQVPDFPETLH